MREELQLETTGLMRAWADQDPAWLGTYLVSGVEDPRINAQSILTRHFLIAQRWGDDFPRLRSEEQRFAGVLRWWLNLGLEDGDDETRESLRHGLRAGRDNAEGTELPPFVHRVFQSLPVEADEILVPNYLEQLCSDSFSFEQVSETFSRLWERALGRAEVDTLRVLELACGSANDYRFMERYGLARFLDYTGVDLNSANIANARRLVRSGRFEVGNVFELSHDDQSFEVAFLHDLLEHLSLGGVEQAVAEICRVTRKTIAVGFFSMHERQEDRVRVVGDYHCNTLSLARMRELFGRHGFSGRAFHLSTLLEWEAGCVSYHNPNAYTLILTRAF